MRHQGRSYVDGGRHSSTNADILTGERLDAVILVAPMSAEAPSRGAAVSPVRWMVRRRIDAEVRALHAVGTSVVRIEPGHRARRVMGLHFMDQSRAGDVLRAAFVETGRQVATRGSGTCSAGGPARCWLPQAEPFCWQNRRLPCFHTAAGAWLPLAAGAWAGAGWAPVLRAPSGSDPVALVTVLAGTGAGDQSGGMSPTPAGGPSVPGPVRRGARLLPQAGRQRGRPARRSRGSERASAPDGPGRLRAGDAVRVVTVTWVLATRLVSAITFPVLRHGPLAVIGARRRARRPAPVPPWWEPVAASGAEGVVDAFIVLGPTFVKLGQLMASAPGVFPKPLATACERCLDAVPPVAFDAVRQTVEEDLGKPLDELFRSIERQPLASASIGQVHGCVLGDGRRAVVKVQRPGIARRMLSDLRIAARLALLAERFEAGRRLNLQGMVADLYQVTVSELDFGLEAHHQQAFCRNIGMFGDNRWVTAPEVYQQWCGPRVICMERLSGVPVDEFDTLRARGFDGELLMRRGLKVGLEAVCLHGPFHADTHAGNIWVLDDGTVAFLDFGITGELPPPWRAMVRDLFLTFMVDDNWARVVRNYKELGVLSEDVGTDTEIGALLQVASQPVLDAEAEAVDLAELFTTQLDLARQMGVRAPRELMLVAKQLFYFERYMKVLAPGYRLARDLFLIKNIWPVEAAAAAAERGIDFPE